MPGWMDKAKKLADQAQSKLDEVQKQFNESAANRPGGDSPVDYDQHGRPVRQDPEPPHGDPLASTPAPPADPAPQAAPEPPAATPGQGDPLADAVPSAPDAPKTPKPPSDGGYVSGDPLAG